MGASALILQAVYTRIMKNRYIFTVLLLVFVASISIFLYSYLIKINMPDVNMPALGSENIRAQVVEIIEDGDIDLGGVVQRYQIARVIFNPNP